MPLAALADPLPPICARTGTHGTQRLAVAPRPEPLGVRWLLVLFGPLGWTLLLLLAAERSEDTRPILIPYCAAATAERESAARCARRWSAATAAAAALAVGGLVGEVHLLLVSAVAAWALCAASMVVHHRRFERRAVAEVRLDLVDGRVTIRRIHPSVAAALRARIAALQFEREGGTGDGVEDRCGPHRGAPSDVGTDPRRPVATALQSEGAPRQSTTDVGGP